MKKGENQLIREGKPKQKKKGRIKPVEAFS